MESGPTQTCMTLLAGPTASTRLAGWCWTATELSTARQLRAEQTVMGQYGYSLGSWLHVCKKDVKPKDGKKHGIALATFAFTFFLTGCLHPRIGPQSVPRDRVDYSSSLSDSWKQETLLNIVKVRYLDPPVFVDVGNVVASYNLSQTSMV